MTELTDERLAEMRLCAEQVTQPGRDHPTGERLLGRDILALLDEITRLRAENAELVAARSELVEGLRPWVGAARISAMNLPGVAPMTDDVRVSAGTLGDCRRAAELVARHGREEKS